MYVLILASSCLVGVVNKRYFRGLRWCSVVVALCFGSVVPTAVQAQTAYFSGTALPLGSGFSGPKGVAVDGSGNVFVADYGHNAVEEILAAGGYTTVNTLGSGFNGPLSLENSDFGNGALSVRAYLLRIWCSNLAITQGEVQQVHLGRRLDDSMLYSQRTYELDAEMTVSALKDVIDGQLSAEALRKRMDAVREAHKQAVDIGSARDFLRKALLKTEAEAVVEAYNSPDTENLPAGSSKWRLSNAISWIAGKTEESERKLELMKLAGEVLPSPRLVLPIAAKAA
jgi:hypothetical protein